MHRVKPVIVFPAALCESLAARLPAKFEWIAAHSADECVDVATSRHPKLLIVYYSGQHGEVETLCKSWQENDDVADIPIIAIAAADDIARKLQAFDVGCDDYIVESVSDDELGARINRIIFNRIANEQLKGRIQQATEMAYIAMTNASVLGVNIQFLLDASQASNLDELGQLFFRAVGSYELTCSIQLRSEYGAKNMEENGMAKELESQILTSLADRGRFYDFGRRTVINYGVASILIKNMPLEDQRRYGEIRDNIFALIQGLDARTKALDTLRKSEQEKALVEKLAFGIKCTMETVDGSFQAIMRDIASVVEEMAERMSHVIPAMSLSETQESTLETIVDKAVGDTQRVFNQGLKVDEQFVTLVDAINRLFAEGNRLSAVELDELSSQL